MGIVTQIRNRFSDELIFESDVGGETASIRLGAAIKLALKAAANLQWADLRGANLQWADLQGADLRGANLQWADLHGADLQGADLRGANLQWADLHGADLQWADLQGADLRGADLLDDLKLVGNRPLLQVGPIGSRVDYLTAFLTENGVYLRTGCFFGTVAEFRASLAKTHVGNIHALEYSSALDLISRHAEIWSTEGAGSMGMLKAE